MMEFPVSRSAAVFSAKSFLAGMLALYVALRTGLPNPFWAVVTAYVVAQPRAGAVLSKSVYRVLGTIAGACVSVLFVPPLVQAPELLSLAVAAWLGLCVFLSATDKTARAYMFVLAGYSTCIIVFPSVAHPEDIFTTASLRVEEITLGIVCAGLVHSAVFPTSSGAPFMSRLNATMSAARLWTSESLTDMPRDELHAARQRLAIDVHELHDLLLHHGYEVGVDNFRIRAVRALLQSVERIFLLCVAVEDRLAELRKAGPLPPAVEALIQQVRQWLEPPPPDRVYVADRRALGGTLEARCLELQPQVEASMAWNDALLLNFLARLAELVSVHSRCLDLWPAATGSRISLRERRVLAATLVGTRRSVDRDYAGALFAAVSTTVTLFLACMAWILSGWVGGANAVMLAGVFFALYSGFANPAIALRKKFVGVAIRIVLGAVYLLTVLPGIDGFPLLVLALAPILLTSGVLLTVPRFSPLAFNLIIGILSPSIISDRFVPDFAEFLNNGIATLIGVYFAMMAMRLSQSLWIEGVAQRLLRAGRRDIAVQRYASSPELDVWRSRMVHRLAQLTQRTTNVQSCAESSSDDALRDTMIGLALARMTKLESHLLAPARNDFRAIADETSTIYERLMRGQPPLNTRPLLESIDRMIKQSVLSDRHSTHRESIINLISLRRNMFPQEAGFLSDAAYHRQ